METRNQPMHVAGLNIYSPPPGAGPHFVSQLLAGWGRHLSALPPFNQRPVLRRGLWYWEDDTEFELDYHLRHLALPHPGRIRELLAMISRLHGNLLDRNRPLWEAYVIEGLPQGRFATYTKIHHALVDGVTGARIMAESLARTADEDKPPVWAQVYSRHPTVRREAPAKGLIKQLASARAGARHPAWRGRRALGYRARRRSGQRLGPALSCATHTVQCRDLGLPAICGPVLFAGAPEAHRRGGRGHGQ
jgi:diacylglycerol O-acyltransferase